MRATPLLLLGAALLAVGCRDVSRYSSRGDHYEGDVVKGSFVRTGIGEDARMCLSLDADHLQDAPGSITTADGRFRATPLRPIPQIWHDPLSTLSFGEGRRQNLVYAATPDADSGDTTDLMVFLSLMSEGGVEVRLVRGAPAPGVPTGAAPVFGVFTLERRDGACSF
ncbi:MAG: hypothetical protein JWP97_3155 [Labilithrix sp.]|nr:hypothetical protein [Labilithrix sp.]